MEKVKNKLLGICIIISVLLCSLVICCFSMQPALAEEDYYTTEDYTNDDYLINSDLKITQYADSMKHETQKYTVLSKNFSDNGLYTSTIKYAGGVLVANNDDPIVQIIPKSLFKQENDGIVYVGREYGFFIKTEPWTDGVLLSTVSVFDIINEYNEDYLKDQVRFGVKNLFQREFVYFEKTLDKIPTRYHRILMGNTPYDKIDKSVIQYINIDKNSVMGKVVPLPYFIANDNYIFEEIQNYNMTNIYNMVSVMNEQHLNDGDEGYNPAKDKGRFIIQQDTEYSAKIHNVAKKEDILAQYGEVGVSALFDVLNFGIGHLIPGYSEMTTFVNIMADFTSVKYQKTDYTDKQFYFKPEYVTAQGQIENTGRLSRMAQSTLCINKEKYGDGSFLFYDRDNFFNSSYTLGYTPVENEYGDGFKIPWEARIRRGFVVEFTNADDMSEVVTGCNIHDFKKVSSDREYKEFEGIKDTKQVSILPDGDNLFLYKARYTGNHSFTTSGAVSPVSIRVYRVLGGGRYYDERFIKVNENDLSYNVRLGEGYNYIIRVVYNDKNKSGQCDITADFAPKELTLGQNNVTIDRDNLYFRFKCDKNVYYDFQADNEIVNFWYYDENLNQVIGANYKGKEGEYVYVRVMRSNNNFYGPIKINVTSFTSIDFKNTNNATNIPAFYKYYWNNSNSLPVPEKAGYIFEGWWTSLYDFGELVNDNNIEDFAMPNLTLYAKWRAIEYSIKYVTNGDSEIEDGTYITDHVYELRKDTYKEDYVFYGWYDNPELQGYKIDILDENSIGDKIFYARWVQDAFRVNLNVNKNYTDGVPADIEQIQLEIKYNQNYNLPIPNASGFTFIGWFNGNKKYTNEYGESVGVFLEEDDIDLIAIWSRDKYFIKINADGSFKWLTQNGENFNFSDTKEYIEYNKNLCPNCNIKSQIEKEGAQSNAIKRYLFKEGHIFKNMIFDKNDSSSLACWHDIDNNFNDGDIIEIFADYRVETNFKIYLKNDETDAYTKILEANYGDLLIFESFPTKTGYTFKEFIVDENYEDKYNGKYVGTHLAPGLVFYTYNPNLAQTMPDLSIGVELDGSDIYLKAVYTPNEYAVNFAGTIENIDSLVVTFGKAYNSSNNNALPIPTKTGYDFVGWYLDLNDETSKVTDEQGGTNSWNVAYDCTLQAKFNAIHYQVTLDFCGGIGEKDKVEVIFDKNMPNEIKAPTKTGYTFLGFFEELNGAGMQFYDNDMQSVMQWTFTQSKTIYAYWQAKTYTVTLDPQNGTAKTEIKVTYDQPMPSGLKAPTKLGHEFMGYYLGYNDNGTYYYNSSMQSECNWDKDEDVTLYAYWYVYSINVNLFYNYVDENGVITTLDNSKFPLEGSQTHTVYVKEFKGYIFSSWEITARHSMYYKKIKLGSASSLKVTIETFDEVLGFYNISLSAIYDKDECIAEGSLITLADGSQKAVEELSGSEELLVWNMFTGKFDTAPILFIDSDPKQIYEVINLYFSDGISVKVISEHAFWDFNLNKYVFLRRDADKYIGHWFNKQTTDSSGNLAWGKVQLVNVQVKDEITTAYSPVTYSHLCYYVNGMLSMPGATEGLINIFDIDSDTMTINKDKFNEDINQYGLFTYEEFVEIVPVTEEIFNAFNGQYLKVAIGKGLITIDRLTNLFNRYFN